MGTGVLAVTLHWLNVVFFVLLAVPWLARWIRHTAAALMSLQHPVQAPLYPTFSIALIVLALLAALWPVTLAKTLRGVASGALLRPH